MLNIMRKQAGSWIIKVLLGTIVVVFIFFYWGGSGFQSRDATKVADVNGEIVTYDEYRQAYGRLRDQYRQIYGNAFNEELLEGMNLKNQALNQLVDRTLLLQEAQRLNINVTDESLDEVIYKIPAFQKNGVFDVAQAEYVLSQNGISTSEFRTGYRQQMVIDKMEALVTKGLSVPESEALEWYNWYNAEVNLTYFLFPVSRYKEITLTDDELEQFYKENGNKYKTEPQVKVNYIFFDPKDYSGNVTITQEDIESYYNSHLTEFKTDKTVEARHILLKLDTDADEKKVADRKQEADKIFEMAKSGKSFEELAKQYSEGPTREQGGYLGAFKKDAMVKPFADKAFTMKAGEISEPVRTRFGWHIIKVEKVNEASTQSLEEASESIKKKLIDTKSRQLAMKNAESFYDMIFDGDDLSALGKSHNLEVKTADYFTRQGFKAEGIGNTKLFADTAFGLEKMAVSEVMDLGNGYCTLQVVDRIEAKVPEMTDVIDKVRADLTKQRQNELAKADAEKCLAELKTDKNIKEVGAQFDIEVMETGFFKRTGAIPKIGYVPEISEAAFELKKENIYPEKVFEGQQGWYVIQLKERKPPVEDRFAKEKESITDRLTRQKKQAAIKQLLADLRARGKVEINQKMIQ